MKVCPECGGVIPFMTTDGRAKCWTCGVLTTVGPTVMETIECTLCGGKGGPGPYRDDPHCPRCNGLGVLTFGGLRALVTVEVQRLDAGRWVTESKQTHPHTLRGVDV